MLDYTSPSSRRRPEPSDFWIAQSLDPGLRRGDDEVKIGFYAL